MVTKRSDVYLRQDAYVNVSSFGMQTNARSSVLLARTRDGVPLRGWKKVIQVGGNATTPLTGNIETLASKPADAVVIATNDWLDPSDGKYKDSFSSSSGHYLDGNAAVAAPNASLSSATNQAAIRALDAVRQQNTHFQAGIFLGEFKESVSGIRKVTKEIASLLPKHLLSQNKFLVKHLGNLAIGTNGSPIRQKTRKVKPREWQDIKKGLSDKWLEFSFGLRPLLGDVKGLAETAARFQYDERHTKVQGFGESTSSASVSVTTAPAGANLTALIATRSIQRSIVKQRYGLKFSSTATDFGTSARLVELLGFKTEDFVPTVWNLLPYSFLVDYFSNVGGLLSSLTTDVSGITWTCISTVKVSSLEKRGGVVTPSAVNKSYSAGGGFGGFLKEKRTVTRGSSGVTYPLPEFKLPPLLDSHGDFNQQLINITALLSGGSGARRGF